MATRIWPIWIQSQGPEIYWQQFRFPMSALMLPSPSWLSILSSSLRAATTAFLSSLALINFVRNWIHAAPWVCDNEQFLVTQWCAGKYLIGDLLGNKSSFAALADFLGVHTSTIANFNFTALNVEVREVCTIDCTVPMCPAITPTGHTSLGPGLDLCCSDSVSSVAGSCWSAHCRGVNIGTKGKTSLLGCLAWIFIFCCLMSEHSPGWRQLANEPKVLVRRLQPLINLKIWTQHILI